MDKKENTVVLFPQLSERYIDEGFLALKERKFEDALRCFEILRQYNAETEQTELASVICLLELKLSHTFQEYHQIIQLLFPVTVHTSLLL
ncbi:hypothetical protein ACT4UT_31505, partial [Bacillus sp. B-TM1]